jgi:hypothetical protein
MEKSVRRCRNFSEDSYKASKVPVSKVSVSKVETLVKQGMCAPVQAFP